MTLAILFSLKIMESFENGLKWKKTASTIRVKAHLHQASAPMLQQLCDDTSDYVLFENNGVAWKWVATPFWSSPIVYNETKSLVSSQSCRSIGADAWCKCNKMKWYTYLLFVVVVDVVVIFRLIRIQWLVYPLTLSFISDWCYMISPKYKYPIE